MWLLVGYREAASFATYVVHHSFEVPYAFEKKIVNMLSKTKRVSVWDGMWRVVTLTQNKDNTTECTCEIVWHRNQHVCKVSETIWKLRATVCNNTNNVSRSRYFCKRKNAVQCAWHRSIGAFHKTYHVHTLFVCMSFPLTSGQYTRFQANQLTAAGLVSHG